MTLGELYYSELYEDVPTKKKLKILLSAIRIIEDVIQDSDPEEAIPEDDLEQLLACMINLEEQDFFGTEGLKI